MWKRKKKKTDLGKHPLETKDLSINEIRKAIHAFSDQKPAHVPLSVLIHEDLTLDYDLLAPYLHAQPSRPFYMSRETYELFEESDYELAKEIDIVQRAVDEYMKQQQEAPVIDDDPYKRINYYKLKRLDLLHERPEREYYLTKEEFMITYKKPK
ncbi:DUF3939 domain-containing protein [Halobacillus locisalis]|uniref:DUF3939 domain-containing protein n=1 Tax=Halobacillus locisalis TaxID=220753 RepID=A0A838CRU5_9BACI|nr:DUF3939 domain-containing protein [Halobacillus locisalis]MBA2174539.1 DUF3939 domain-containing protein [Halobacillus locisalis]